MTGQSETKHTPGELRVSDDLYDTIEVETNAGHDEIARTCFINRHDSAKANLAEERANAARIALTWNCHDELVAACQAVVDACTSAPPMDLIKRLGECADKCAAALAKASA